MNQPAAATRRLPTPPEEPYRPYAPGSILHVKADSPTLAGKTVVVKRWLPATGSYAVHVQHHEARDGFVYYKNISGVEYAAPEQVQPERKVMLHVPAARTQDNDMVKFTPLPAAVPEAPRPVSTGTAAAVPQLGLVFASHVDPLTKAEHIRDWMRTYDRSRDQAALSMGVSIGTVDNFLYLLKAPDALKARLRSGQASMYKAIAEMRGAPKPAPADKPVPVPAAPEDAPTTPTPPPPAPVAPTVGGINLAALKPERYRRQNGGTSKTVTTPTLCFTACRIGLNAAAMAHLGETVERVHLFFDAGQRVVVIAAAAADDTAALSLQRNSKKLSSRKVSLKGFCDQFDLTPPASPVRVEAVLHNSQLLAVFPAPEKAGEA